MGRTGADLQNAAQELFRMVDEQGHNRISITQFRQVLSRLNIQASQQETESLCDAICPSGPRSETRGARSGMRGGQRGQRLQRARELRTDAFIEKMMGVRDVEEEYAQKRQNARPAAESLRKALQDRSLSLVHMLSDLDPYNHRRVSFKAFRSVAKRHRLNVS